MLVNTPCGNLPHKFGSQQIGYLHGTWHLLTSIFSHRTDVDTGGTSLNYVWVFWFCVTVPLTCCYLFMTCVVKYVRMYILVMYVSCFCLIVLHYKDVCTAH